MKKREWECTIWGKMDKIWYNCSLWSKSEILASKLFGILITQENELRNNYKLTPWLSENYSGYWKGQKDDGRNKERIFGDGHGTFCTHTEELGVYPWNSMGYYS